MEFRKTKAGLPLCPFITWTSEDSIGESQDENDVSLVFCNHPKNSNECEGNCQEELCPLLKE